MQQNPILTEGEIERYKTQIKLSELQLEGQQKIKNAKVLVVGGSSTLLFNLNFKAGGLGSSVIQSLAAAGVGVIGIVDGDKVDSSNLHRQIIHCEKNINMNKAQSAQERISLLNSFIKTEIYETKLTKENCDEIAKKYDILVDASDNYMVSYLLNDYALLNKKILISGAAEGWEFQITVFGLNVNAACYRCLNPVCPTQANLPSPGVIGMIPGIAGQIQALEVVKLIIDKGSHLSGEMLIFDGLLMKFKKCKLRQKSKDCILCGNQKFEIENFDYLKFTEIQKQDNNDKNSN